MSYLVLARKYRPKTFDDLVGQESVSKGLSQAIAGGRIGHAFLFIGSRGTGKTSSARILAKALNCATGPTPAPCGACDSCRGIDEGNDVDVLEIDAASNNGVENVRELRERVAFRPMRGRFRVTILDEVHMLSGGAFNALLKTLEEPPAHAKFIFATTAPEKIPDTIRSRCQVFEFKRIEEGDIVRRLAEVCSREGVEVAPPILASIARAARGGMRDSLSLLDQVLAYSGGKPAEADLAAVTGAAGGEEISELADAVIDANRAEILRRLGAHAAGGGEPLEILTQLADRFRSMLLLSLCGAETELVTESGALRARMLEQSRRCDADRCEAIVRHLVFARERARFAGPLARAAAESALLAASRSGEIALIGTLAAKIDALERRLEGGAPAAPAPKAAAPPSPPPPQAGRLLDTLAERNSFGRILRAAARSSSLDGKTLRVVVGPVRDADRLVLRDPVNRAAAEKFLGVSLVLESETSAAAAVEAEPPAPSPDSVSPAVKAVLDLTDGRILGRTRQDPRHGTRNP